MVVFTIFLLNSMKRALLTINSGSSSIKLAAYDADDELKNILRISVENIGTNDARITGLDANNKVISWYRIGESG